MSMLRTLAFLLCGGILWGCSTPAARQAARRAALERDLRMLADSVRATVGAAVVLGEGDTLTLNDRPDYPMASVCKFHQALAVLDSLERARLTPDFRLPVRSSDLLPDTWSPLRDARPEGGYSLSAAELLRYSVALSDNNACDLLFRFVGGPAAVERHVRRLGATHTRIGANEATMHRDPATQHANTTSPLEAVRLLERFRRGEVLGAACGDLLMRTMISTATGPDKLKGALPAGTTVAHKTGSGFRDAQGIAAADNDIGIVFLPDGRSYSVAVFIAASAEDDATDAAVIARISRRIYDYFISR